MNRLGKLSKLEFQEFLYEQIPVTKSTGFKIEKFDIDEVVISAPMSININHKATAFGGSINSLMTTCAWAGVFKIIKAVDENVHIVIQRSSTEYLKPIRSGIFHAICKIDNEKKINRFVKTYKKMGKARINMEVFIEEDGVVAAKFVGDYVVFK